MQTKTIEYEEMDFASVTEALYTLAGAAAQAVRPQIHTIGTGAWGQQIPVAVLGEDGPGILYISGVSMTDGHAVRLLVRFLLSLCRYGGSRHGARLFGMDPIMLLKRRRLYILPCLLPLSSHPVPDAEDPLRARLPADINGAFAKTSTLPPSLTPEAAALRQYIRYLAPAMLLQLSAGRGDECGVCAVCGAAGDGSRARVVRERSALSGRLLARAASLPFLETAEAPSPCRFFAEDCGAAAYHITTGIDECALPADTSSPGTDSAPSLAGGNVPASGRDGDGALLRMLYTAPLLSFSSASVLP